MSCSPLIRNKVLQPNFQCIIAQPNNGCGMLLLILAKLLDLDISCENTFALSIVTAITACPLCICLHTSLQGNCYPVHMSNYGGPNVH